MNDANDKEFDFMCFLLGDFEEGCGGFVGLYTTGEVGKYVSGTLP